MHADGGVNSGWGCEVSNRAYGLNDPSLEGFPGDIFKVISAPFKAGATVVKTAVTTAVKVAPGAITGFLAAGPAGAVVGGASRLFPSGEGDIGYYTPTPIVNTGSEVYGRSPSAFNPYGVEVSPYQVDPYQRPYQAPQRSLADQAKAMFEMLKSELLATAGRKIAETEEGRQAIQQKITGDIGRYLLPISLGVGGLILVLAVMRR